MIRGDTVCGVRRWCRASMETRSQFVSIMPHTIALNGACFSTHRLMAQSVHNVDRRPDTSL
jgi:hypothetical protein